MNTHAIKLSRIALLLGFAGIVPMSGAQAALVGETKTALDADVSIINGAYLVYDHNGVNANIGELRLFSTSTTLAETFAEGNSSTGQVYATQTEVLTIHVNNSNGAFVDGTVGIDVGTNANQAHFSWTGTINSFGFANVAANTIFDATWTVTSDNYANSTTSTPFTGALSQFTNGYLAGGSGGIVITNTKGFGVLASCSGTGCVAGTPGFGNDWIMGTAAQTTPSLSSFIGQLDSTKLMINSTVKADIFATPVPEASTYGMMLVGLAMLAPLVRRKNKLK